jgi:DNA repair protein RadD
LIIIDEVHLVGSNEDSMYGKFLADIRAINPRARFVGMSATPFRTGEGPVCGRDKLFQRICYEAFTGDMIREGWLCPITNKAALNTVDTSKIKRRGSEFINSDMARAFDSGDKVAVACSEIVNKCEDRHSVLVFAAGVEHAEHVADTLRALTGERVGLVTGDTMPIERVASLSAFKAQELRWLVNCDVLTTGFDAPCIDAIAVLRATMSPGLFAQIVGRGLRKHESVSNCLILDFGQNIARHGSIDDPNYGRATAGSGSGSGVEKNGRGKACLNCGIDVPAGDKECPECGFRFPDEPKDRHDETSDDTSTLTGTPDPETWEVLSCAWGVHVKKNAAEDAPRTLRVDYTCQPAVLERRQPGTKGCQ